jgi:microcystin-dependent protein
VPSGAAVSPGGAQGVQGIQGPQGVAPPGAIMSYAGSTAPTGWLLCDGSAVSRTTYAALFTAISTTYGAGDGSTTFNLPDTRGRTVVGAGQGTGLSNRLVGAVGGEETHQLTIAELASHTHTQNAHTHTDTGHNHTQNAHNHSDPGHAHVTYYNPQGVQSGVTQAYSVSGSPGTGLATQPNTCGLGAATATNVAASAAITTVTATNQNTGTDGFHNTMQPFLVFNQIIKT